MRLFFLQTGNQARFTAYGAIINRRRLLGQILPDSQQCYDVSVRPNPGVSSKAEGRIPAGHSSVIPYTVLTVPIVITHISPIKRAIAVQAGCSFPLPHNCKLEIIPKNSEFPLDKSRSCAIIQKLSDSATENGGIAQLGARTVSYTPTSGRHISTS